MFDLTFTYSFLLTFYYNILSHEDNHSSFLKSSTILSTFVPENAGNKDLMNIRRQPTEKIQNSDSIWPAVKNNQSLNVAVINGVEVEINTLNQVTQSLDFFALSKCFINLRRSLSSAILIWSQVTLV